MTTTESGLWVADSGLMLPSWMRQVGRKRTNADMTTFQQNCWDLVEENQPCSARNVYYVGIGQFWEKDEFTKLATQRRDRPDETRCLYGNYDDVVRNLGIMREWFVDWMLDHKDEEPPEDEWPEDGWPDLDKLKSGLLIPFDWLVDGTRSVDELLTFASVAKAITYTAENYIQSLWASQDKRVQVWAESDSSAGMLQPVTYSNRVPLYSSRGQSGKRLVWDATQAGMETGKPVTVLSFGDHDSSGVVIRESVEERRQRYSGGDVEIAFKRLGVTPDDVRGGNYQTHQANKNDPNYPTFKRYCEREGLNPEVAMELEAIPAPVLRDRLENAIDELIDVPQWNTAVELGRQNRQVLADLADIAKDSERLKRAIALTEPRQPRFIRRRPKS